MTNEMLDKNRHIPTAEVNQDILDTQKEIDDYSDEKDILMRNPLENKVRIYFLEGKISQRQDFIKKLETLLKEREEEKQEIIDEKIEAEAKENEINS